MRLSCMLMILISFWKSSHKKSLSFSNLSCINLLILSLQPIFYGLQRGCQQNCRIFKNFQYNLKQLSLMPPKSSRLGWANFIIDLVYTCDWQLLLVSPAMQQVCPYTYSSKYLSSCQKSQQKSYFFQQYFILSPFCFAISSQLCFDSEFLPRLAKPNRHAFTTLIIQSYNCGNINTHQQFHSIIFSLSITKINISQITACLLITKQIIVNHNKILCLSRTQFSFLLSYKFSPMRGGTKVTCSPHKSPGTTSPTLITSTPETNSINLQSHSTLLLTAAVWADDIKSTGVKLFDNYHFTNIVYDPDFRFNGMTQYQQDVNSINTINWCNKILKLNKNGVSFERAWMARYLLHLVGDIHQPLHNTNMFNLTYKTGDLGGNMIKITTIDGKSINLHAYFDSIALDQDPDTDIIRPLNDTYRKEFEDEARSIMNRFPAKELEKELNIKDPHAWGVQSYKIAVDKIYSYTRQNNKITEQYQREIREILMRQIALGGYRLARNIADIYA